MQKRAIITDLDDKICPFCGTDVLMPDRVCSCCGAVLEVGIYLPKTAQAALVSGSSGVVIWVLCFLFGDVALDYVIVACFAIIAYGLVQYRRWNRRGECHIVWQKPGDKR